METEDKKLEIWVAASLEQNRAWLTAYLHAATGIRTDADDLVQDVFLTATQKSDRYRPEYELGAWLRGIARNKLHEYWRGRQRQSLFVSEQALDRLDAIAEEERKDATGPDYIQLRISALQRCIERLSERSRAMLWMKYRHHKRSAEIAVESGTKPSTVDVILSRTRQFLGICIQQNLRRIDA